MTTTITLDNSSPVALAHAVRQLDSSIQNAIAHAIRGPRESSATAGYRVEMVIRLDDAESFEDAAATGYEYLMDVLVPILTVTEAATGTVRYMAQRGGDWVEVDGDGKWVE